jgi:hypothetical protein
MFTETDGLRLEPSTERAATDCISIARNSSGDIFVASVRKESVEILQLRSYIRPSSTKAILGMCRQNNLTRFEVFTAVTMNGI